MCFSTFGCMDTQQGNKIKAEGLAFPVHVGVHWYIHIGSCAHIRKQTYRYSF